MASRIQVRRGTTDQWLAADPVLAAGEPGMDLDTGQVKWGDGATPWDDLTSPASADTIGHYRLSDYFPSPLGTIDPATDATPYLNAALADMYEAGGGTLVFPALEILIAGQIVLPNDTGVGNPFDAPRQPAMIWQGAGGFHTGQVQSTGPVYGGTRLRMTYQGATYEDAKVITRGLGRLAIRDMTWFDPSATKEDSPFLLTTNTTLHVSGVAFVGSGGGGTGARQDAIVLGGTLKHDGGTGNYNDPTSAFQGYGTVIERCYFDAIRRAVYGRSYCNHTVTRDCFMDKRCGTDLVDGACIEFDSRLDATITGADGDNDTANVVSDNYMNGVGGYAYQVKLIASSYTNVAFNGAPDQHTNPAFVAFVRAQSGVDPAAVTRVSYGTMCFQNYTSGGKPQLSEDAATAASGRSQVFGVYTEGSILRGLLRLRSAGAGDILIDNVTIDGDTGLRVQPAGAGLDASPLLDIKRSTADAIDAGVSAFRVLRRGSIEERGVQAGHRQVYNSAGTLTAEWLSAGRWWRGHGGMEISSGTTYQNLDLRHFSVRFYDKLTGDEGAASLLRMRVGGLKDGFDLGAASDCTVQRDSTGSLAVNQAVKTKATTTAGRPTAASVGAGGQLFDTTLNRPIWSTGSAWVGADGATV